MDDKMLKKRMELLNKNYEKLPNKTDASAVIKAIENEKKPPKPKRPIVHWPYAASFIGVLLIASVLVLQFVGGDGNPAPNGENNQAEMTEKEPAAAAGEIKSHYNVRTAQAAGSLGVSKAVFAETPMAKEAEEYVSYVLRLIEEDKTKVSTERQKDIEENLNDILMTPQQMVNGLTGKQLAGEEAEAWVMKYTETHDNLLPVYNTEMENYQGEWKEDIVNGELDGRDILLEREKEYSEELITLVEGATANGISLAYSQTADQFQAASDMQYLSMMLSSSELPEAYMDVLRLESYPAVLHGGIITTNWVRAGGDLLLYERAIENLPLDSEFREQFLLEYTTLFTAFVKGSSSQSIFNEEGILKPEIKEAFENLMKKHPETKTAERVGLYFEKLKEHEFAKPEDWEQFNLKLEM
ncbi:hypothetical protein [Bacillus sp. AK031]